MWVKIIIFIGIGVSHLAISATADDMAIYQRNYNIYDTRNWLNHTAQTKCEGFVLNSFFGVTTSKLLRVQRIVFGRFASFMFNEDTQIVLDANTNSVMNCVAINTTEMTMRSWSRPDNWLKIGRENNVAVPHFERSPCQHDNVVFPAGILTGMILISGQVTVRSLKFGDEYLTNTDLQELNKHEYLSDTLMPVVREDFKVSGESCVDPSGCVCGNQNGNEGICYHIPEPTSYDCSNPISPIGFCYKICGASITFKPSKIFRIDSVENKLRDYSSDTHVSKVVNGGDEVIQVIFTEKEFTGACIEEAKTFYKVLEDEKIISAKTGQLSSSGYNYDRSGVAKNAVSVIFMSLLGVCFLFAVIIFVFGTEERNKRIRERLGLGSKPITYRSMFFSRQSVSEGTGLIDEGQSVAGSMQNIPKSFENLTFSTMKKSSSTSTSSASSTEDLTKEQDQAIEKQEQNMTFEEKETRELIETVAEEGELVDLSDMG